MEHVLSVDITAYADSTEGIEAALDDAALAAMLAAWSGGDDEQARWIAFELKMIIFFGPDSSTGHRRINPMHRSMRRCGKRYQVRKDHGTVAWRKQIDMINERREADKPSANSVRSRRRERKLAARSGQAA